MRKTYIIIIIAILILAVAGILLINQNHKITPEEAEKLCYSALGEKDGQTGFPFSFATTETVEKDGEEYYVVRASWLVNNSHFSYIGDFFVKTDGKEIYNGFADDGEYTIENIIWSK